MQDKLLENAIYKQKPEALSEGLYRMSKTIKNEKNGVVYSSQIVYAKLTGDVLLTSDGATLKNGNCRKWKNTSRAYHYDYCGNKYMRFEYRFIEKI